MVHFVYIAAYDASTDGGDIMLAFEHIFIFAKDIDQAYSIGRYEIAGLIDPRTILNDYVVELKGENENGN